MVKVSVILSMALHREVVAEFRMAVPPRAGEALSLTGPQSDVVLAKYGTRDFEVVQVQHEVVLAEGAATASSEQAQTVKLYVKHYGSDSRISPEPKF